MFERARREKKHLVIGLCGEAGSGKTFSALALAQGLALPEKRIALLDCEEGAASLYADRFAFDMHVLDGLYCPSKYVEAIGQAGESGYEVLVLDGISNAWGGPGGVLEQVDAVRQEGREDPWAEAGEKHMELLRSMAAAPCHIIATIRARPLWEKAEHQGRGGRSVQRLVRTGLRPLQRSDIAYHFNMFWQLSNRRHAATALKDSTGLFDGQSLVLGPETGRRLRFWMEGDARRPSGLERALQAIRACSSVSELATLWGDWPAAWRHFPWQDILTRAVAQRLRELQVPAPAQGE